MSELTTILIAFVAGVAVGLCAGIGLWVITVIRNSSR
jgi:hypothetical protein